MDASSLFDMCCNRIKYEYYYISVPKSVKNVLIQSPNCLTKIYEKDVHICEYCDQDINYDIDNVRLFYKSARLGRVQKTMSIKNLYHEYLHYAENSGKFCNRELKLKDVKAIRPRQYILRCPICYHMNDVEYYLSNLQKDYMGLDFRKYLDKTMIELIKNHLNDINEFIRERMKRIIKEQKEKEKCKCNIL